MLNSKPDRSLHRRAAFAFFGLTLLPAFAGAATFRVNVAGGGDTPGCGSEASPCATIQHAVNLAVSGDTILVAQGTYADDRLCATGAPPGFPTVVCVQKDVTILGGFDPSTDGWSVPNPSVNTTIIDGGNARRGVIVNRPEGGLRMEGFTIRDCVAQNNGSEFGGGMWAVLIGEDLTLRDMVFLDNITQAGTGMQAGGGGLAIVGNDANIAVATLERVRFERNEARGGGVTVFGSGLGGGFHADHAIVTGLDLELIDNKAIGGADGDGLGGGASFSFQANVQLEKVHATGNTATGGANRWGLGGAFFLEGDSGQLTQATITDAYLSDNRAEGPAGAGGGAALGFRASLTLARAAVIGNRAVGNVGAASAAGGGVYFWAPDVGFDPLFVIRNSIIAENVTEGTTGGGAGVRLLGATASLSHTTVVDNEHVGVGLGSGISAGPAPQGAPPNKPSHLTLAYSIVAGHTTGDAVFLQADPTIFSTGTFNRNQFTGNLNDRCNPAGPLCTDAGGFVNWGAPGNNIHDGASPPGYFVNPGTSDYHIDGTSPPVDAAAGSTESVDFDGATRSAPRDIGADEFGAAAHRLTVRKTGTGSGTVVSDVNGISCGSDCTEVYPESAVVNLMATPDSGFFFAGYGGDSDCTDGNVTMTGDIDCDAPFVSGSLGSIVVEKQTVPDGRTEAFFFSGDVAGAISDGQQLTSLGLLPGTYTVMETDHALFDLTNISCDDAASTTPSTVSIGTRTATFQVDPGETVTCTFTNTITTCSAAEDDVVLPNVTQNGSTTIQACSSITGGPYTVGAAGNVTLESPVVVLRNDFIVLGTLTVVLNVP